MGVFARLRELDTRVLGEPSRPTPAAPRPPRAPDPHSLSGRLRRLDNDSLGEPLTREQAYALLAVRRPRSSTRFALTAAVAAVLAGLGIAGVIQESVHFIVFALAVTAGIGWLAIRLRSIERAIDSGSLSKDGPVPPVWRR